MKGVLIHWSIKLKANEGQRGTDVMKGLDSKFPILIADQYQSMEFFMITRIGNVELTKILGLIEENF